MPSVRSAARYVVAIGATSLLLVGCGSDDQAREDEILQERSEAAEAARDEERIRQLEEQVGDQSQEGPGAEPQEPASAPSSGGSRSCGDGVLVDPPTSCSFGLNVKNAYYEGDTTDVHSPTTGKTYDMSCGSESPHLCTGGASARVYFP